MSGSWTAPRRSRLVPVGLILLAHLLLAMALLRFGGMTDRLKGDDRPASYIAFAFIPAPMPPQPAAGIAPPPVKATAPVRRVAPALRKAPEPAPALTIVDLPAEEAATAPAAQEIPATERRIDMASLRAAARRIDSERAPAQGDGRREPERLRSSDDSDLARAVRQAKQPDCQTKYAGGDKANLLLLVPLAIDTVTGKGCRW